MVSNREERIWITLCLGLLWATLAWMLYDQLTWVPEGSPAEVVHQLARKVALLFWGLMGVMGFGALAMTRLVYCALRTPRRDGGR
jgi:hypothetical protein